MKDWIRVEDEIMHVGADWNRLYSVDESIDLTDATAVCKIRDLKDNVLLQATCTVYPHSIVVWFPYEDTLTLNRQIKRGKYDVFIQKDSKSWKLVMGEIEIIHDISMH